LTPPCSAAKMGKALPHFKRRISAKSLRTMPPQPQPEMGFFWFILLFIGLWLAVCCLLSVLGGWHALAKKYRSGTCDPDKLLSRASMELKCGLFPVNYGNCIYLRFDSAGLELSIFPLWRFFHPRLSIPWNAVTDCRRECRWFWNCTSISLSEPQARLRFFGKAGRELYLYRNPGA
jgi:hypothetical protein